LEENRQSERSGSQELMTIVVIGGSQGAHRINTAVMEALPHLAQEGGCRFIHQTGKADEAVVREAYAKAGIAADVGSFFHDMAQLYTGADLLICRAGATTVAEVTSIGKGAIFIPYPYAADNHQVLNAQALVDEGAAEIILEEDLSGAVLAEKIRMLSREPDRIREMNQKARMFGRPEAAAEIAADVYTLIENE
jgi:UDP-N-acetylglucosamine--N-acetylmuramyl-(pentapeptide) pyrophosphoryl-undecaprenol N-acetylglucosamine transferase